jgi:AcrR family transcriptional regulator
MRKRLVRSLQVERNRQLVLKAARRVFLAKGYAGSSLEAIAEEAGFSKGVVYSQFDSKADLFLALLERRISERAQQNERVASGSTGAASVTALIHLAMRNFLEEPEWALLVAEFRIQAARDASLNSRYAKVHARTVERLAHVLARVHERAGLSPAIPTSTMAEFVLALGFGVEIERFANPRALPLESLAPMLARALGNCAGEKDRSEATRRARAGRKR